jgi:penicillin-binding protein 2
VDLPQEKKGLIPDPSWYDRRWGAGRWHKGLLLNLAIGQGELLTTPIQLALLAAESATAGRPVRPHLLQEARGWPAPKPRPARPGIKADPADWAAVQRALEHVVESGTGTASRVRGVRVGGKTGTAQNPHGEDHALFVCYAPADDPRIALAVVIENGGHGGSAAAPRAGQVLADLFLPDSLRPPPRYGPRAAGAVAAAPGARDAD